MKDNKTFRFPPTCFEREGQRIKAELEKTPGGEVVDLIRYQRIAILRAVEGADFGELTTTIQRATRAVIDDWVISPEGSTDLNDIQAKVEKRVADYLSKDENPAEKPNFKLPFGLFQDLAGAESTANDRERVVRGFLSQNLIDFGEANVAFDRALGEVFRAWEENPRNFKSMDQAQLWLENMVDVYMNEGSGEDRATVKMEAVSVPPKHQKPDPSERPTEAPPPMNNKTKGAKPRRGLRSLFRRQS